MLEFIDDVLYGLKLEYGKPATFIRRSENVDLNTGTRTATETSFTINNVVVLPINLRAAFMHQVGLAKMGYLEPGERSMVIHKPDIPTGKSIMIQDIVSIEGREEAINRKPEEFDYGILIVTKS